MASSPCLALQLEPDSFSSDCGKCQVVEEAEPMREEKALIERAYSEYPRKDKKVSVTEVEMLGPLFSR